MADVTAVLTVWKRDTLARQLAALRAQTRPPAAIWIYHCGDHRDPATTVRAIDWAPVNYARCDVDLGYFGRFALAAMVPTPLVHVLDDDIIPGPEWLAMCHAAHARYGAVVSGQGCLFPPRTADVRTALYPVGRDGLARDVAVDFGCGSWFLATRWIERMWATAPATLRNGEDLHLGATMAMAGIATVVPAQAPPNRMADGAPEIGRDAAASWRKDGFYDERNAVFAHLRGQGWKTLLAGRAFPAAIDFPAPTAR